MNLDSAELIGQDDVTNIVRGCPCYREFGEEKVCLNNDSVYPIRAISVDPSFFNALHSKTEMHEFESGNEAMCYLVTFLDRAEGYCYCVSQNKRIRINHKDVKVAEIDRALQFVTSSEKHRDGVLCSDCLYRYLRTLGESSEGYLTNDERTEIVRSYVRNIANTIAMHLSHYEEEQSSGLDFEEHLSRYIKELNKNRSQWASTIRNLKKQNVEEGLIGLVEAYRTLSRLESIFLYQVQSLDDEPDHLDPLDTLQLMVNISERVISVNDEIRIITYELTERNAMPKNIREMLSEHSRRRKETEYRFSNLVTVLHEIDSHHNNC